MNSLFEMHYVSKDSAQARFKMQQEQIHNALQQLSIKTRLEQVQEHEKLVSGHHLLQNSNSTAIRNSHKQHSMWYILNKTEDSKETMFDRPFSPYDIQRSASHTLSSTSTLQFNSYYPSRQRTPSMTSSLSSALSVNTTTTSLDSDRTNSCSKEELEEEQFQLTDRDDYGFKRPVQWVKKEKLAEFEKRYTISKEQQKRRWRKLLHEYQQQWPPVDTQLSRFVRKGVATNIRSKAWFHYSGAHKKLTANPMQYQSYLEAAQQDNKEIIKKDVHRTFPDNIHFASSNNSNTNSADGKASLSSSLYRVLSAFSQYAPDIGYCQSLNFLVGFLLLIFDNEEEKVFWMLVTIVRDYFPAKMFDKTIEGGNLEQTTFMLMIYEKMPGVWSKISNNKCFWECEQKDDLPPITLVTNHWFLTMFINILPVETVLRIWDCFFLGEGFTILYQVALTILKLNERQILAVKDFTDVFQILQNAPKRMIDCDEFMECVFSSQNLVSSNITVHEINSNREVCRKRKIQRKLNQLQLASIQL